jgi:hypothetical protein
MGYSTSSLLPTITQKTKRDVQKVPYVELYGGRLHGVVSSGSDIERVYVSYFEVGSLDFYCSTNNNRPCGGLRGSPCKHLESLLSEAVKQYGFDNVVQSLRPSADLATLTKERDILRICGHAHREPAGEVFSRFLEYLQMLELPSSTQPLVEMDWFIG